MKSIYKRIESPVGQIRLVASQKGLTAAFLENDRVGSYENEVEVEGNSPILMDAETQLREYFSGRRREFSLPLDLQGTDFQKRVWRALLEIPYGETRSYGDIARRIGKSGASRAVGGANNRNRIVIIVPCHRVIGASGALTGYGGGLDVKARLLDLEKSGI